MNERAAALVLAIIAGYNIWFIIAKRQPFRPSTTTDLTPMVQGMGVMLLGFAACDTAASGKTITPPPMTTTLVYWDGIIPRIRTGQAIIDPYLTLGARHFIDLAAAYLYPALMVLTIVFVIVPVLLPIARLAFGHRQAER